MQPYSPKKTAIAALKFGAIYAAGQFLSDQAGLTNWLLEHFPSLQALGGGVVSMAIAALKNAVTNWAK